MQIGSPANMARKVLKGVSLRGKDVEKHRVAMFLEVRTQGWLPLRSGRAESNEERKPR